MHVIRTAADLTPHAGGSFVPTMGALHDGHLALIRRAAELGRPAVVSIFVNPTQFGPGEDYDRYPRDQAGDLDRAAAAGADIVFMPDVETMYPPGHTVPVPPLPAVATQPGLEDADRPGHFAGVCQVVARLLDLVRPAVAVFGEKDYQQLLTIEAMVAEQRRRRPQRWGELRIQRYPTVREPGGLAMSSRNAYLTDSQRERARGLVRALQVAHAAQHPPTAEQMMRSELEAHELSIDYAVVRDATTLMPVTDFVRPTRGLIAARLDTVRLIDNMSMTQWR